MKFTLTALSLIATAVAFAKTSTPEGWIDDYDLALTRAGAEKKLVVADFSGSDWCGWCKKLDQEVFDTEVFRKGAAEKYILLMIDSPSNTSLLSDKAKQQNPKLVDKYGIRGFPTVLVLDAQGEVVTRLGYKAGGPENYLKLLEEKIGEAPEVEKYIKPIEAILERPDKVTEKEQAEIRAQVLEKYPLPTKELTQEEVYARHREMSKYGQSLFFAQLAPKYAALCEESIAEARAMKVSSAMEERKANLIESHEKNLAAMKKAMEKFAEKQKK